MPYCRRCGTKLEDDAKFCHKCGTPTTYIPPQQPTYYAPQPSQQVKPLHKDWLVVVSITLVAILVVAVVAVTFLAAPFASWDANQSLQDTTVGVKTLNLNFNTNVGDVLVFTQKMGGSNIGIFILANGTRGAMANSGSPVTVSFDNSTVGDVLTVDSTVKVASALTTNAHVQITMYIDPALVLNLNITSTTGKVSFSATNQPTITNLRLKTTTGQAEANLEAGTTIWGSVSVSAVTGEVNFRMNQAYIVENCTLTLHSTTGSVNSEITQTKTLDGNLDVQADTSTGSVNMQLTIDGGVAARVTSHVGGLGDISVDKTNFVGADDDFQSVNYPAQSNINVESRVHGFGDVNVQAVYLTTLISS